MNWNQQGQLQKYKHFQIFKMFPIPASSKACWSQVDSSKGQESNSVFRFICHREQQWKEMLFLVYSFLYGLHDKILNVFRFKVTKKTTCVDQSTDGCPFWARLCQRFLKCFSFIVPKCMLQGGRLVVGVFSVLLCGLYITIWRGNCGCDCGCELDEWISLWNVLLMKNDEKSIKISVSKYWDWFRFEHWDHFNI